MGKVIQIKEAERVVAGDPVITYIDECYERLSKVPGFSARPGQRDLSVDICRAMVAGDPIAAEAPTGTGKTLAYLVGALAAAEKLRGAKDVPLVIATATVGLQNQILTGDIPRLVAAGILPEGSACLAKGRSRYFCAASAERVLVDGLPSAQDDLFEAAPEGHDSFAAVNAVADLLADWNDTAWTGDRDSYTKPVMPLAWAQVGANSATCLGHKCDHYAECPFFAARRTLSNARIAVANHSLVLADLSMSRDGSEPLFPGRYLLVFDEAHHLPDKAIEVAAGCLDVPFLLDALPKLGGLLRAWQKHPELLKLLDKSKLNLSDFDPFGLTNSLEAVRNELSVLDLDAEVVEHRFEGGVLPEGLEVALKRAAAAGACLKEAVHEGSRALKQANLAEKNALLKPMVQELLFLSAGASAVLGDTMKALTLLSGAERAVRWVQREEGGFSLHTSPLEGADVLRSLLWGNERVSVAAVSATLQDFQGFERFKTRAGAPENLRTVALPHIFPYRENTLYLVTMRNSPRQDERVLFLEELAEAMPKFINPAEGTLVLFPSQSMMRAVTKRLKAAFPGVVLCQGDVGVRELVRSHTERIETGKGSVLCGLATLAEGLDLPGELCTHVIICALPFTVPTSPVEREQQELLGKDYFVKRALPDALTKMVQMTGRLMRRETDRGRITVFDNRLAGTRWGRKLMDALPDFKRNSVRPDRPPLRSI